MSVISFTVYGNPMGKQRARTLKTGISYTPKETVNYETLVKLAYGQLENKHFFDGQIWISIIADYPIPKSTSKAKFEKMESGAIRPTKKPDTDNIAKIICDSLNGIAYRDDSQVVTMFVEKYYSIEPKVMVRIGDCEGGEGLFLIHKSGRRIND